METIKENYHDPQLSWIEKIALYCQTLFNRLTAELQRLLVSILEAQVPPTDPSECSCHQSGHCRIVIETVIDDDGTTLLEPTFLNCTCGPISYDHHQGQLERLSFSLKDKNYRIQKLRAFEEGIRLLLLRHREILKAEIRHEQYWLRQDYARTNLVRELRNHDVLKGRPNAAKIPWSKIISKMDETPKEEQEVNSEMQLFKVEKEDLWIYADEYEYNSSLLDESFFSKPSRKFEEKGSVNNKARESSPNTLKEEPTLSNTPKSVTSPKFEYGIPEAPSKLRLGPIIDIKEVLARFEDIKVKASEYVNQWNREDTLRANRFTAIHPKHISGNCSCTPEHRLYHSYLDATFDPPRQLRIEAELHSQVQKTDIQEEFRQKLTINRQAEVDSVLQLIEIHVPAQIADLEKVQGVEGRLKALVAYLRKYDGREDLQAPDENVRWTKLSAALTFEIVERVDSKLERWLEEDEACRREEKADVKAEKLTEGEKG